MAQEVLLLTQMDSVVVVRADLSAEAQVLRTAILENKQVDIQEKEVMRKERKKVADDLVQVNLQHVMFKTKISKFIEEPIL